jgi:uncharacterized protein (DUF169 family)
MPYKAKNISFGEHPLVMDTDRLRDAAENLVLALNLIRQPVGVRLINTKEEFDSLEVEQVKGKMAYCQMIERASRGRLLKSALENHRCDGATTALAMEPSTPRIESGEEYYSYNLYATRAAARRMRQNMVNLPWREIETKGILTGPLTGFSLFPPDLVILIAPPFATMRLVQGWEYAGGRKPVCDMGAMQGFCIELTAAVLQSGEMNISVLCPSTRMLCRWGDDEMAASIPFERFIEVVEGVSATMASETKDKKRAAAERFHAAGRTLSLDPDAGY